MIHSWNSKGNWLFQCLLFSKRTCGRQHKKTLRFFHSYNLSYLHWRQKTRWVTRFQFVIFKPLSYCFEETVGFVVKIWFAGRPVSHLIRWYSKPGVITKEFWEKAIQFHGTFHGLKITSWFVFAEIHIFLFKYKYIKSMPRQLLSELGKWKTFNLLSKNW